MCVSISMLNGKTDLLDVAAVDGRLIQRIHVLIVDDETDLAEEVAHGFARKGMATTVARSVDDAIEALRVLPHGAVTVVLTDIRMPGRGGLDLAEYVCAATPAVDAAEVVAMTGHGDFSMALRALRSHVFDFLIMPIIASELEGAVRRAHHAAVQRRESARQYVEAGERWLSANGKAGELAKRPVGVDQSSGPVAAEAEANLDSAIKAVSGLLAARGRDAGRHILQIRSCVALLIDRLRRHPRFAAALADEAYCRMIIKAVPLYDIGKIGIPDAILRKPERLSPEEMAIMQTHTTTGAATIAAASRKLDAAPVSGNSGDWAKAPQFLEVARQIAETHHEKWDGTGYPNGQAGDDIPLPGRLMAVADVFVALLSARPYAKASPLDEAIGIVAAGRGTHFDPDIVDAFTASPKELARIAAAPSEANPASIGGGKPNDVSALPHGNRCLGLNNPISKNADISIV